MSKSISKRKNIVVIGGGTGTFTVLSGLKKYPVDLSAIVPMTDSGGSNRVIRDEFGLLPTSDIRQCFVALAEENNYSEQTLRGLFVYRFNKGTGIKGMTFGNLFMAALADIFGSQLEAIQKTGKILKIKGKVLPVTLTNSNLVAIYENGKKVIGEHLIDEPKHNGKLRIKRIYLKPRAKAYPEAIKAILRADLTIIGPGDLYTSLIVNLLSEGIVGALRKTQSKIVYILNLMTRYGQTYGFTAKNHVQALEKYLGKNYLDFALVNSASIPKVVLKKYKKENELPVIDDLENDYFKVIRSDFLSKKETKKVSGDVLKRSFVRHDPVKLAKVLIKL
ncbi:uridine diphosphate-N-acetylglucosamine-binding protein YvcK [Patescibacteria group bacterium]